MGGGTRTTIEKLFSYIASTIHLICICWCKFVFTYRTRIGRIDGIHLNKNINMWHANGTSCQADTSGVFTEYIPPSGKFPKNKGDIFSYPRLPNVFFKKHLGIYLVNTPDVSSRKHFFTIFYFIICMFQKRFFINYVQSMCETRT